MAYVGQIMANLENMPQKSTVAEAIIDFLSCFRALSDLKVCRSVLDVLSITVVLFRVKISAFKNSYCRVLTPKKSQIKSFPLIGRIGSKEGHSTMMKI